jgi:hypothetical protein
MIIDKDTTILLCSIDPTYQQYVRNDGTILVRLKKNLYGLRDAGKKWYEHAKSHFINLGYQQLTTDPCIFIKRNTKSFSIIGLYVDDVLYFSTNNTWRSDIRSYFSKHFQVKKFNQDKLSYLGLQINNDVSTGLTTINQIHYIKELLKKYNIKSTKTSRTIKTPSTSDFFDETNQMTTNVDQKSFRSAVMALMFAAKRTRSDILLQTTYLSSFCGHATNSHVQKLNRIFQYLATTVNKSIIIKRSPTNNIRLDLYADAGHMTHHDLRGHTGVLLTLNDNYVVSFSKKQTIFSESTCESELYAAHTGGLLIKWVINLFEELYIPITLPITFHQDNKSTIQLSSKGYGDFMRTKHIQKRFFSLKDLQDRGLIKQQYCPTKDMKADLYTKSHDYAPFSRLRNIIFRSEHAASDDNDGMALAVQGTVGNQPLIMGDLAPLPKPSKRVTFRLDRNTIRYLDKLDI